MMKMSITMAKNTIKKVKALMPLQIATNGKTKISTTPIVLSRKTCKSKVMPNRRPGAILIKEVSDFSLGTWLNVNV